MAGLGYRSDPGHGLPVHLVKRAVYELAPRGQSLYVQVCPEADGDVRVATTRPTGGRREMKVTAEGLACWNRHTKQTLAWVAGSGPKPSSKGSRETEGAW